MDLLNQLTQGINVVNVANTTFDYEKATNERVFDNFQIIVSEIRELLESDVKPCFRTGLSGKDSSLCLIATLEAYRQSINENKIEKSRPLLVHTVDTKIEALPMKFFIHFGKKHLERYAAENNINLTYDIISPTLSSEFFIKWAGSDKLISNPTRASDCTNILKLDPSFKHLANQQKTLGKTKIISLTGQRIAESANRSKNMEIQQVKDKTVENVINELNKEDGEQNITFSPIRNWSTEDVFTLLRIAGTDPMTKVEKGIIPTYFKHNALLLELYGKNANETCQVTIGANNKVESNGCGGNSNRYGCTMCTRISEDKSAISVSKKAYWSLLGTEDALRVRDWLGRLSFNSEARTMHPKAVDPALNRIIFQPNVLKSRYLEKMVRYASQLTTHAEKMAAEFSYAISIGKPETFPAYKALLEDKEMHPKARAQFLEMYKSEASKPYMPYFSTKHATLLSFKWSMLGVAAPNYRPLAIWNDIQNGKGVIPFPKLNSELPAEYSKLSSSPAEEPIVLRFHTTEFEKEFLTQGESFLNYWDKPVETMDMFENANCWGNEKATHEYPFNVFFNATLIADKTATQGFKYEIEITKVIDKKTGKNLGYSKKWSITQELISFIENKCTEALYTQHNLLIGTLQNQDEFSCKSKLNKANKTLSKLTKVEYKTPYMRPVLLNNGFRATATAVKRSTHATQRVITSKPGKPVVKTTTRSRFYTPSTTPSFAQKFVTNTQIAELNFDTHVEDELVMYDFLDEIQGDVEPIMFNEEVFDFWLSEGGLERALNDHDFSVRLAIKHRTKRRKESKIRGIRQYSNTAPITYLMQSAGLMINPSYTKQYKASLRRTHLLNEVGAFKLQSLSKEELIAYSGTVTMKQHRTDKAAYLLKVRAVRNANRIALKRAKAQHTNNVNGAYETAVNLMEKLFKLANTHMTMNAPKNKQNAVKAWFDYYGSALSNLNSFKSILLSQTDTKTLTGNAQLDMQLSNLFATLNNTLIKNMKNQDKTYNTISQWKAETANRKIVSNMSTEQKNNALLALLSA
ncbi:phosphoadenosine phosphosulfate reductase family protein [Pseudoalteromonas marina]|uniref:Phosphoadenosine phosphosulfate reductase family protein n=1 Tax=Pseudoalteromonas marina TaxID=267375 RepID=A0ABT9FCF4_9GAMM|nr:phosphoadenosine phosphosulfate reductase family protein [Pseudoalteromonas marina]MDP2564450.1 phosphoadenosine phosphosulfate reductase family protein [Pseudoalteromonas marina]